MSEKQSVDDILSSIKNTVEETAASDDEVLALDGAEADTADAKPMAADANANDDDLIDLDAFAETGEEVAATDTLAEAAPAEAEATAEASAAEEAPAAEAAPEVEAGAEGDAVADDALADDDDIDIDSLMAEVAAEDEEIDAAVEAEESAEEPAAEAAPAEEAPAEEGDVDIDALMDAAPEAEAAPAEEAPADEGDVDIDALMAETEDEVAAEEAAPEAEAAPAEETAETAAEAPAPVPEEVTEQVVQAAAAEVQHLSAIPGPNGLQVSFPVEVLAEALRPLVGTWVEQNLPDIAERLIREELSKLAEK